MNIKLDRKIRIRLNEIDVTALEERGRIEQSFQWAKLNLKITLILLEKAQSERCSTESTHLVIQLDASDAATLFSPVPSGKGIMVGDVEIQVDRWNSEKREKWEARGKA
jgi:hypothetical protein